MSPAHCFLANLLLLISQTYLINLINRTYNFIVQSISLPQINNRKFGIMISAHCNFNENGFHQWRVNFEQLYVSWTVVITTLKIDTVMNLYDQSFSRFPNRFDYLFTVENWCLLMKIAKQEWFVVSETRKLGRDLRPSDE